MEREWDQIIEQYFYQALIQKDVIDSAAYKQLTLPTNKFGGFARNNAYGNPLH